MHQQQGALPGSSPQRPLRTLLKALQAAGIGVAATFAGTAGAVGLQGDNWSVDVGGIVNAYYTATSCSGDAVGGPALASKALGCAGEDHKTSIGNGLLPSGLITKFKTQQEGFDIGGTIGIMVHAATSSGVATNTNVDVRQASKNADQRRGAERPALLDVRHATSAEKRLEFTLPAGSDWRLWVAEESLRPKNCSDPSARRR